MKNPKHWVLYFICLPWNLTIAWPAVLLIRLFWGKNLRWETPPLPEHGGPVLTCELRAGSWPARSWYVIYRDSDGHPHTWGGTTLGHAIFYGVDQLVTDRWTALQRHEHVHVEQYEACSLAAFIHGTLVGIVVAALGHWEAGLTLWMLLWWSAYLLKGTGGWVAAWLRGEDPYRGSTHEESAYAQMGKD